MTVSVVCPGVAPLVDVLLDLVTAELIVKQTAKCDAVANGLERSNGIVKEYHACHDEENVLEDTRQGKGEGGGLADLQAMSAAVERRRVRRYLTSITTATFNAKATLAFANRVNRPTRAMSSVVIFGSSRTRKTRKFIVAQAGAK